MSQLKPILNVNSNFERGNTNGFTEGLTSATASFLDRRDARINPKRRAFPNIQVEGTPGLPAYQTGNLLKSRSDYIFNGRFSRRYTIASGGDITLSADAIPVQPGMKVSVDLVYRYNNTPAVFTMEISGSDASGKIAYVVRPASPPRYAPGNEFVYDWQGTTGSVNLRDGNEVAQNRWTRLGFSIEIPLAVVQIDPLVSLTGPASQTLLDVGELSVQALDSVIHATG